MGRRSLVLMLLLVAAPLAAHEVDAAQTFERLKSLVGEWRGTTETGRELGVTYRLSANDTVLVETWRLGPTRESLTLYHLDGARLLATHYCPIGNQPRLVLSAQPGADRYDFTFESATNLPDAAAAHQVRFTLELDGPDAMTRSETYAEAGEEGAEAVRYTRVAAPR